MSIRLQLVLIAFACLFARTKASATTIDFGTLSGASSQNLTAFTTVTENNYTVTAAMGSWHVNNSTFGSPTPSIFNNATGTVSVTRDVGTLFTFSGVDLAFYAGGGAIGGAYTIIGYLSGSQVFTVSGSLTNAFVDDGATYSGDTLSELDISVSGESSNIDNIVVNDVEVMATAPEPESLALVLTGAAGVATMLRRRTAILERCL